MNNPDGTSWPYAGSVDGAAAAAWNDVQRNGNMVRSTSFRFISTFFYVIERSMTFFGLQPMIHTVLPLSPRVQMALRA